MSLPGKHILMVVAPCDFRDEELFVPRAIFERKRARVTIASTRTGCALGSLGGRTTATVLIDKAGAKPLDALILVGGDISDLAALQLEMNDTARMLAAKFWPGCLTMVLQSAALRRRVGVRISPHPLLTRLSPYLRMPVYSTSANISGEPYDEGVDVIWKLFYGKIDFMIDAGCLPRTVPSTVIDVGDRGEVKILREGVITSQKILSSIEKTQ